MPEGDDRERTLAAFPILKPIEDRLRRYADMLRRWQTRINLVGPSTLEHLWWRHFGDSAQVFDLAPTARHWIDLGSGAGFPGLVVALCRGEQREAVVLVESDTRKAAFLREVSRETGAAVEVVSRRAEQVIARSSPPEIVTSRALATVPELICLTAPWLDRGTTGLFLAGSEVCLTASGNRHIVKRPSRTGTGFVIHVTARDSERV